jgi:DNA-binding MarR family transcriptional regulator
MISKRRAKSTINSADRAQRLQALETIMRQTSGLGVVFSGVVADRLGISSKDLECLDVIVLKSRVTAGELATATGLTTGAITGLIDRLEKAGLARRERDEQDRRKVFVRALPRVQADIMPLYASLQARMQKLTAELSNQDIDQLLRFFSASRDVLLSEIEAMKSSADKVRKKGAGSEQAQAPNRDAER